MFSFLSPLVALFLPLPWIIRRILKPVPEGSVQAGAIKVPFFKRLERISNGKRAFSKRSFLWPMLAWFCLVVASMRPVWLGTPIPVRNNARNIM